MRFHLGYIFFGLVLSILITGCKGTIDEDFLLPERSPSENFKSYWFNGQAEITSYQLDQTRYGESREGTAVLIFVTEDFLLGEQVKANSKNVDNIPVLKLNATKKFLTGIYPYSIMQSTFYPLEGQSSALKITASIQEWCGHVYMQLNNKEHFKIDSHSYFEGEADKKLRLSKTYLENEIWTQLRINPNLLPTGTIAMIPSFEFIRLNHKELKAYKAFAEFYQDGDWSVYKIKYPSLNRVLKIYYLNIDPFKIEKWIEETEVNGELFSTTAIKMEEIKTDYWNKNSNKDLHLREQLNLN